ncbi:MAG: aspartyl protease family protein [Bacteroidota bacterium]
MKYLNLRNASHVLLLGFLFTLITGQTNASTLCTNNFVLEPTSTSFDLVRGIIVVTAEMDGEPANFILDTGSPMMILNEKNIETEGIQANSIGGEISGEWKKISQFSWAGVHKFNMKALSMDISHLEYVTNTPIKGLIGYEFFGDFDLMLDFKNKIATLVPPNYVSKVEQWQLKSELDFELEGHIPVIRANIGDVELRMGLDTGAGTNLMDINRKDEIAPELLAYINNASIVGLGSSPTSIVAADVLETTIAGSNYWNMRYVFSDISKLKNLKENNVDGLLGYPFFQSGKFTINYGRKVISFWH